jgi:hypothetical protein
MHAEVITLGARVEDAVRASRWAVRGKDPATTHDRHRRNNRRVAARTSAPISRWRPLSQRNGSGHEAL